MAHIDENLDVTTYFKESARTIDDLAWMAVCVASMLCLLDIYLETNLIPLRDANNQGKAIALLISTPILIFLWLVRARQTLWFEDYFISSVFRAILCVAGFFVINFWK